MVKSKFICANKEEKLEQKSSVLLNINLIIIKHRLKSTDFGANLKYEAELKTNF